MRKIIIHSLLLILFASCSPSTVAPVITTTATNAFPPTKTKTPYPTFTARPASTATLSVTLTPAGTPDPASSVLNSPDGNYAAKLYLPYDGSSVDKPVIEIFDAENKLLWQIPFQGELPEGDPQPILIPYKWSNDSSQLYFHYVWSPDGGDRAFWWSGYDLQKIDVKTGKIQPVLPGSGFMSFDLSPDGTQISYTREQDKPSVIYVRDLVKGSVKKARVLSTSNVYAMVGDVHWSPSGQDVVFQRETEDGIVQTIYLNPATMEQKLIKEYELFTLVFDGWAENGTLQFAEISADGTRIDNVYQVDVKTSETIGIGTPTARS